MTERQVPQNFTPEAGNPEQAEQPYTREVAMEQAVGTALQIADAALIATNPKRGTVYADELQSLKTAVPQEGGASIFDPKTGDTMLIIHKNGKYRFSDMPSWKPTDDSKATFPDWPKYLHVDTTQGKPRATWKQGFTDPSDIERLNGKLARGILVSEGLATQLSDLPDTSSDNPGVRAVAIRRALHLRKMVKSVAKARPDEGIPSVITEEDVSQAQRKRTRRQVMASAGTAIVLATAAIIGVQQDNEKEAANTAELAQLQANISEAYPQVKILEWSDLGNKELPPNTPGNDSDSPATKRLVALTIYAQQGDTTGKGFVYDPEPNLNEGTTDKQSQIAWQDPTGTSAVVALDMRLLEDPGSVAERVYLTAHGETSDGKNKVTASWYAGTLNVRKEGGGEATIGLDIEPGHPQPFMHTSAKNP